MGFWLRGWAEPHDLLFAIEYEVESDTIDALVNSTLLLYLADTIIFPRKKREDDYLAKSANVSMVSGRILL